MKKPLTSFLLISCAALLSAQAPFPSASEASAFKSTKTLVVLESNMFSLYNGYIRKAVQQHWTITPYDFVSQEEFKNKRRDPAFTFLVLTQTSFERDKSNVYYNFLNLLMGKDVQALEEMPEFGSFPLSYSESEEESYLDKLGLVIRFLQDHVQGIIREPSVTARRFLTYYMDNAPEVTGKILLLTADGLSDQVNTPEKIKKVYPYEFRIVSQEEMQAAIEAGESNTLVLHTVCPGLSSKTGWSYKILLGCDDGKMYFFNRHTINPKNPGGFLSRDFSRLARY